MIKIKTVSGQHFFVTPDISLNVKHLKQVIALVRNIEPNMKLVYSGKILNDNQMLANLELTESSFIVMVPSIKKQKQKKEYNSNITESNITESNITKSNEQFMNDNPLLNLLNQSPEQLEARINNDITKLIYGQTYIFIKNLKNILKRNELLEQFDNAFPGKIDEILNEPDFFDKTLQEGKELIESGIIQIEENNGEYNKFQAIQDEFNLTNQDLDNIQHLAQTFNLPVDYVLQVYLACNKDVDNTSNIL
jgi:hypothetical protein